jgi:hypothetical protein
VQNSWGNAEVARYPASSAPAARAAVEAERAQAEPASARVPAATDPVMWLRPSSPASLGRNADLGVGLGDFEAGLLAQEFHQRRRVG